MRILFIGDIVGRSGRTVVLERLPSLVRDWKLDFVAVNGENAAGGFGITEAIYQDLVIPGTSGRPSSSSSALPDCFAPSTIRPARPGAGSR
jgi:YmdB-like protein